MLTAAGAVTCFLSVTVLGLLLARPLAFALGVPPTVLPGRTAALARPTR